jgi:hypothetical protein
MTTETFMPKIIYGSSSARSKETCHSSQGKVMSLRDGWSRQQWDGVKMDYQELESFFGLSRDHF